MKYKINTATSDEIKEHLLAVGLPGDARKIKDKAVTYEVWDGKLVGLLAVYDSGYITNLSVFEDYRKKGIATQLLKMARKKFKSFELETKGMDNLQFYFNQGFKVSMQLK